MYSLSFKEITRASLPKVGGKNASLGEMIHAGMRVPTGFAVTTDSYIEFVTKTKIKNKIFTILSTVKQADIESVNEASVKIRSLFEEARIPKDIDNAVRKQYAALCNECVTDDLPVAVRSSATAEDMPTASFAGQQETYLWIQGPHEVSEKIKKCWSSLFTSRAISYRIRMGFPNEKVLMSVGVQKMVNAKSAGVMFTLDPTTGDPSRIVIEANWGLGESVVSGSVNPDKFVVDRVILEISERKISNKCVMSVFDPVKREVVCADAPPEKNKVPCLNDDEIIELARCGKRIHGHYNCPQDIEWAIDKDMPFPENVLMVQSRPETVWSQRERELVLQSKSVTDLVWESVFKKR